MMIIAELKTKHGKAFLRDDGRWVSNQGSLETLLNSQFGASSYLPSPSEGIPRQRQLDAAATRLGGSIVLLIEPTSVDGRIY